MIVPTFILATFLAQVTNGLVITTTRTLGGYFHLALTKDNLLQTNSRRIEKNALLSPQCRSRDFKLHGFFDDFMKANFGSEDKTKPEANDDLWSEADFRNEVEKRNSEAEDGNSATAKMDRSTVITSDEEDKEEEFDGYMVRLFLLDFFQFL